MKRTKQEFGKKIALAVAAALLLLTAGCGSDAGSAITDAPSTPVVTDTQVSTAPETTEEAEAPTQTAPTAEEPTTEEPTTEVPRPLGMLNPDTARLNVFLTSIVQQNIVDTQTDLDEDAEMVRFVFGYRKTNDPRSILEQEDGGVSCRTLSLEQVNETLTKLFGKSISPDREDYSILSDEDESANFHCFYRDGVFWNVPPYPVERYPFPVRFALVSKIDEETSTVHIRLYRANPSIWGEEETERHIGVLPFMTFTETESSNVISYIGDGYAILLDYGNSLQLVEMAAEIVR